jgi:AraC-like DNA-binding protein
MAPDPLDPVLTHFGARARLFFAGTLCGDVTFGDAQGVGYLHLLRAGTARLYDESGYAVTLAEPTLVFYSRPLTHRFETAPADGADLVCASMSFEHQAFNPVALALPARFACPLHDLEGSRALLELLFDEAFAQRPGRQEVLNRLFEVVLIEVLRVALARQDTVSGFLRSLSHPQLGKALAAMHAAPAQDWTLYALAEVAGMSRSSFAATFKREVGDSPGNYLTRWRVMLAQAFIREGLPLKLVAERVGYASLAGFLRAFKGVLGVSPTSWRRADSPAQAGLAAAASA